MSRITINGRVHLCTGDAPTRQFDVENGVVRQWVEDKLFDWWDPTNRVYIKRNRSGHWRLVKNEVTRKRILDLYSRDMAYTELPV